MVDVSRVRVDFLVSEDFLKQTPRKMNGWNLRIRAPWKFRFYVSIFAGVTVLGA